MNRLILKYGTCITLGNKTPRVTNYKFPEHRYQDNHILYMHHVKALNSIKKINNSGYDPIVIGAINHMVNSGYPQFFDPKIEQKYVYWQDHVDDIYNTIYDFSSNKALNAELAFHYDFITLEPKEVQIDGKAYTLD